MKLILIAVTTVVSIVASSPRGNIALASNYAFPFHAQVRKHCPVTPNILWESCSPPVMNFQTHANDSCVAPAFVAFAPCSSQLERLPATIVTSEPLRYKNVHLWTVCCNRTVREVTFRHNVGYHGRRFITQTYSLPQHPLFYYLIINHRSSMFRGTYFLLPVLILLLLNITETLSSQPVQNIGTHLATLFDAIYVIGLPQCRSRWQHIHAWAAKHAIPITPIYATSFSEIDLHDPPIPITGVPKGKTVTAGQVACTVSHIRAWRQAFAQNYSRVIILEDDIKMTPNLMQRLNIIVDGADLGASKRQQPWHYLYLRMHTIDPLQHHTPWHVHVSQANPGWGTAAYILSSAGIRYLLTRVTTYSFPLDVQIERLQRGLDTQGAPFVALHACRLNEDHSFPQGCPEDIEELPLNKRTNCFQSATAVGASIRGAELPAPLE